MKKEKILDADSEVCLIIFLCLILIRDITSLLILYTL